MASTKTVAAPKSAPAVPAPTNLSDELAAALAAVVPQDMLKKLLERRTSASKPREPKIEATSATAITVHYLQPVREYWWNPIPQRVTLTVGAIPPQPAPGTYEKWVAAVSALVVDAAERADSEPVTVYLRPETRGDWFGIAVFAMFTGAIVAWIFGVRGALEQWVFTSEMRFNMAVLAHAGVLVKRSRDVRRLGTLMDEHWRGGKIGRLVWSLSAWVEGWRAVGRFMAEIERVRLENAVKDVEGKGKKGESKKKR
ncbi:hypothetical protein EDC01DRAFT_778755 [Geopyxis carbonaria]|nr:hypothetical protein EDC01DRAFT_778755 [Geopyxis carbonaria]